MATWPPRGPGRITTTFTASSCSPENSGAELWRVQLRIAKNAKQAKQSESVLPPRRLRLALVGLYAGRVARRGGHLHGAVGAGDLVFAQRAGKPAGRPGRDAGAG